MELQNFTRAELAAYVSRQLTHFFPDGRDPHPLIAKHLDSALDRFAPSVALSKMWPKTFSYLHSNQYCVFLYYLSNTLWKLTGDENVCSKLFYLNKALHGFECFYLIEMPDVFCVCHSPGIVLAQATYANYLVLYQNSTVGRVDPEHRPVFEEGVVLYPNTAVIGNCHIGARTYVSQGQSIIDGDTPGNCIVFNDGPRLVFKKPKEDLLLRFFRMDEA